MFDSGFNLPPGCFESDLPGNRPQDVRWQDAVESLEDEDVIEICKENFENCTGSEVHMNEYFGENGVETEYNFIACTLHIIEHDGSIGNGCLTDCPFIRSEVEKRAEDR